MKLFYYKEPTKRINYYQTDRQVIVPDVYKEKEIRALWVSNVVNIDMPITEPIDIYEKKCQEIISTCQEFNINTIFFQVRTTNDAFYESELNPYSRYLTGVEGKKPPYDVFKYFLKLAREKRISVHAWCNPYRVSQEVNMSMDEYLDTCSDLNFAKKRRDLLLVAANNKLILNPAKEEVKQFIIDSVMEIVKNYDVDGIHFDDYFYPYEGLKEGFDDSIDFENRKDKKLSLGDFRRDQITDVIKRVYKEIKVFNPKLEFGVSPFGVWMNKVNDERGSNTDPKCSQSYDNQYADTYAWVKEEIIDYIVPQLYWEFGHPLAPFADLCDFWVNVCKDTNVKLYIGHGAYRLGNEGEYENKMEIINQIKYANDYEIVKGNVFFTYNTFIDKNKSFSGMQELKKLYNGGKK